MKILAPILLFISLAQAQPYGLWLDPDSIFANNGDTVTVQCWIGPTPPMRGFAVYLAYDTNHVDLVGAPQQGSVIQGHSGLQFGYFDHTPIIPNRLEVGGTVFSTDFWEGPGPLFSAQFRVIGCGDFSIYPAYPPDLVDGTGASPDATMLGNVVLSCERVALPPDSLTIVWAGSVARLRWRPVTLDTLGRLLISPPLYRIFRSEEAPLIVPFTVIDSTLSTSYDDASAAGETHLYYVTSTSQ